MAGSDAVFVTHSDILNGQGAVIELDGALDSSTGPDVEEYFNRIIDKKIRFILMDARALSHVSSEGIGLLLILQKKIAEANGFFVIFNLPAEVMTLFRLLGFDKVFSVAATRSDAIQILDRQRELREGGNADKEPSPAAEEKIVAAPSAGEAPHASTQTSMKAPTQAPTQAPKGRIVECHSCRATMRVPSEGEYLCPSCGSQVSVSAEDGATAAPKNIASVVMPIIIECARCGSLVRVTRSGKYRCPDCGTGFSVSENQTIQFNT